MPVRRDRTYQLALISSDGKSRLHLRTRFPEHDLRSQVIYRTSPGGRWLAFGDNDGAMRLLDAAHHWYLVADSYVDYRFSPDGRWLAVAVRSGNTPPPVNFQGSHDELPADQLLLVDLSGPTPVSRSLAKLEGITYVEWSAAGVLLQRTVRGEDELTLVSLQGAQRVVRTGPFRRFASAARGFRVLVFLDTIMLEYDLSQPDRLLQIIETDPHLDQELRNVEMAADGSTTLYVMLARVPIDGKIGWFTERNELFLIEGTSTPRLIDTNDVSSLWADDAGARFVWQNKAGMHLGGNTFALLHEDALTSVRFRRDAPGFVAARGRQAVTWNATGQDEVVRWSDSQTNERLIGADLYAGGLVVWIERDEPRPLQRR